MKTLPSEALGAVRPPPPPALPLWDFIHAGDRADSKREPFFTGRDAELLAIANEFRLLGSGYVGGRATAFQGAPGAGKSALMHEAAAMAMMRSKPSDEWAAVLVAPSSLAHPENLAADLLASVLSERGRLAKRAGPQGQAIEASRQRMTKMLQAIKARGGGVAGARIGAAQAPSSAGGWFRWIADEVGEAKVVVLVDEAQNVPTGSDEALDLMARGQTGMNLLPMFFGLSNAVDALTERGLSRPPDSAIHNLQPMSSEDARTAFAMMFDAYGTFGQAAERWIDELAALSQGWPQHMNRIGAEALGVLDAHGMDADAAPLAEALANGAAAKRRYYDLRLRGLSGSEHETAVSIALEFKRDPPLHDSTFMKIASQAGIATDKRETALDLFVKRGILAPVGAGCYEIPVPSMAAYLGDGGGSPKPRGRRESPKRQAGRSASS